MNIFLAVFLMLPPAVIAAKEILKIKSPIWFIFFFCVVSGWLLANLAIWKHYELLDELVRNTPVPSEELLEQWQSDGAPKVFALYFGWTYAAFYFLLCLLLLNVIRSIKSAFAGSPKT